MPVKKYVKDIGYYPLRKISGSTDFDRLFLHDHSRGRWVLHEITAPPA